MTSITECLAFVLILTLVRNQIAAPLPTEYVEYWSRGDDFYVGVIAELTTTSLPFILVTTDGADVNFTVSIRDPPFEQNATVRPGSVVSISLPVPAIPSLTSSTENELIVGRTMGVHVFTEIGRAISVYVSQRTDGISLALPCKTRSKRVNQIQYSYHLFPSALAEQPLARSLLLLVGCQDATQVQVFSTSSLSLPAGLNATIENFPSGDTMVTSFYINRLESVTLSMTGDISSTYITTSRLVTVSLASLSQCNGSSAINSASCVSGYAQIVPSFTWGRKFLVSSRPSHGDGTAEYMIQTGLSTSTSVTVTCNNFTGTYSVFQDRFLERSVNVVFKVVSKHYCSIESEQQIQVTQYNGSRDTRHADTAFPLVIPPTEQYSSNFTFPLLQHTRDDLTEESDGSVFYATIFVSSSSLSSVEAEGSRVMVDGQHILDGWNAIYCRGSELCGYGMEVQLPLQSAVNITHQNPEVAFSALVHRIGVSPFSYAAGFRLNDLTASIVYLESGAYEALEEDVQEVELAVVRDGNTSRVTDVLFTTQNDTALGGEDFIEVTTTLQFLPGERRKMVTLTITNDQLLESDEIFNVSISVIDDRDAVVARENSSITIIDNDSFEVGFEMESYTVDEVTGLVEVNIISPTPYAGSSVVILMMTTMDGTAEAPDDYFPLNVYLPFTPGTQHVSIAIHAFEDLVVETELEWFSLTLNTLSAPATDRVFVTQPNTTVFIEDRNKIQVELVPSSIMIKEGDGGGDERSEVTLMVFSSGQTDRPITVFLVTTDHTATAGEDYVPLEVALTFTANQTAFNITLETVGDEVVERDEVVMAELVVPEGETGVSLKSRRVNVSIIDDDSVEVVFMENSITVEEGAGVVELTVVKSGANSRDVFINFATLDGDAAGTEDYTSSTGRLTFTPLDTIKTLVVVIRDDNVVEYQERFFVVLSVPKIERGVVLREPRRVAVTIANDDIVEVAFSESVYTVREEEGLAQLVIIKIGSNARAVAVAFTTSRATATSSDDFTSITEIIMFRSEDASQTVSIPIVNDLLAETLERFTVTLLPTVESVRVTEGRGEATVEITDNDIVMVGFSESVYTVQEGAMVAGITLAKRGITNLPVTLQYHTEDDSATASEDYISLTDGSITFSGQNDDLPAIQLRLRDDNVPERTEQLLIHLVLPPAVEYGLVLETSIAAIVILDDDDVEVRFDSELYRVSESSSRTAVRLLLLGDTSNTVTVTLRTTDRDAVAPGDYPSLDTSVVFLAGVTEQMVVVSVVDDTVLEGPESFSLLLSPLSAGVVTDDTTATVVIEDNDVISVGFQTARTQTAEDAGVVQVRVELDHLTEVAFTVLVTTQDDTATAAEDYIPKSASLLFVPGVSSAVVDVTIISDSVLEPRERFLLSLSSTNDTRVTIQPDKQITIIEILDTTEVSVGFMFGSVEFSESREMARVVVVVTGVFQRPLTIQISTVDGTATAGEDYREQRLMVTVPAGNKYHIVEIPLLDDALFERDEYFFVQVSSTDANVIISTSSVNVTIKEDDRVMVTFDPSSYTVSEGDEEVIVMVMMVENNTLVDVEVNFETVDDTAIAIADYVGEPELLLTFGPTTTRHEIRITIIDDPALEHTESFTVQLTTPPHEQSSVIFPESQAAVSILDNDEVFIEFAQPSFLVIEGEPVIFLTLVRSGISYIDIQLNITTSPDSATADVDYVSTVSPVRFETFQSRQFVPVTILDDQLVEGNESFNVSLETPSLQRGVQVTSDPARIIIQENDYVVVVFDPVMYTVLENAGHVTVTASVEGNLIVSASVTISTSPHNATARDGEDFTSTSVNVDIHPNDALISATIPILDDVIPEGVEVFQVVMSSFSEFVLIDSPIAFVQIIDQDGEGVRVGFESVKYVSSETEGEVQVCLTTSSLLNEDLSFLLYTKQRSAHNDEDFVPVRREVQFGAGQLKLCLSITILDDSVMEKTEDFLLVVESVSSNGVVIEGLFVAPAITDICITDNDNVAIGFVEASVSVSEGSSSSLVVKVEKIGSSAEAVSVAFMTEEGTARSGVDYTPLHGVLEYSETEYEKEIAIPIIDDSVLEGREHFSVVLSLPEVDKTGVTLARERLQVEIEDDDIVEIGFVMDSYMVSESQKQARVCIIKSIPTATVISVNVSTQSIESSRAAESFVDYIPVTMTVTFPLGEGNFPECIQIPLVDDAIALEPNEEFRVILTLVNSPPGVVVFSTPSTVVTIVDNDDVSVGFETSSYIVNEDEGTLTLCLTKDKTTARSIPLLLTAMESTPLSATVAGDFSGESVEVILGSTANAVCVSVNIIDDSVYETTQHFDVLLDVSIHHPNLKFGRTRNAEVTILDNDVITVIGANSTVDESEGSVSVCLMMDKKAEVPVSVDLQFSRNVDPSKASAQGGIDYDSTPRSLVFPAGETHSCSNVDIFPDTVSESVEQFNVIITTDSNSVLVPQGHSPVITITDNEGPPSTVTCRALDSIVIEPFRSSTAVTDSYTFHSPCEHILLTTCDPTSSQQLRVTVNFNPSNLNMLGLAAQINRTATITLSRDKVVNLTNFPTPIFSNGTLSLYPNGVSITTQDRRISITLSDFAIKIECFFTPELHQVQIEVLEGVAIAVEVCGLCGSVDGELVMRDGNTEVASADSDLIEEFAESWRVSPQEVLLGKQGEECGSIRNDTIIGDPLFTVPLDFPSPTPVSQIAGATPHLCFEVHGERDTIFNLISDRCTSVNALFTAMTPPSTGNIISTVAIKTVDYRGNCIEVEVSLQSQCAPVIRGSNGQPVSTTRYNQHGVSVRRHRQGVRVAVPNCENTPLVVWILCEENRNQSMIKFVISRGVNLSPTSHGILGQFWNIPVTISPITPLTSDSLPPPYILTLSPPSSRPRQFLARLHVNTWDKRNNQCFYAGSSQGGPLGELESPHLRDSVIEGRYTQYIMEGLFETQFQYTRFDSRECTRQK